MISAPADAVAYFELARMDALRVWVHEDDDAVGSLPVVGFDDGGDPYVLLPWRPALVRADAIAGFVGLGRASALVPVA